MTSLAKALLADDVSVASKSHDHPCPPPFPFRSWVSWRTLQRFWMKTAAHPPPSSRLLQLQRKKQQRGLPLCLLSKDLSSGMGFPLNYSRSHHALQAAGGQVGSACLFCCLGLCRSPGGFRVSPRAQGVTHHRERRRNQGVWLSARVLAGRHGIGVLSVWSSICSLLLCTEHLWGH